MPVKKISSVVSTRDRILRHAKKLFQRRGYYAIGTAEILKAADAPKGSMYHHFPAGKEQIAIEAVHAIRGEVLSMLDTLAAKEMPVAIIIRTLARGMAHWLKKSEWREGTMLTSVAIGSVPDLPQLHAAIKAAFDAWQDRLVYLLVAEGWKKTEARNMAQTIIAATEGAMILARIDQDTRAVIKVAETMARLVESHR